MIVQLQTLIADALTLAQSLGIEFTWLWFYIQLGIIAATVAYATVMLLRRRWSPVALLANRPLPVQLIAEAVNLNLGWIIFTVLAAAARAIMLAVTWPGAATCSAWPSTCRSPGS